MTPRLPRDLRAMPEYRCVRNWLARARPPSPADLADVRDLAVSPDGTRLACTATRRLYGPDEVPGVAIASMNSGAVQMTGGPGSPPRSRPGWSPDGRFLACLERQLDGLDQAVILSLRPGNEAETAASLRIEGTAEGCWWSPDGSRLLVLHAEPGAEISDVFGSGRVAAATGPPPWLPAVPADEVGWRRLSLWDPASGHIRGIGAPVNVWEAQWAGPDMVCAVVSARPHEDDWYDAQAALITVGDGDCQIIDGGQFQVAVPRANPSGTAVSFVTGMASDRGLVAGRLALAHPTDCRLRIIDALGTDVTDHRWRDDSRLTFTGVRDLCSVIGEHDLRTGTSTELWSAAESIGPGDLLPEVCPAGQQSGVAVVLESHARPPAAGLITGGTFGPVVAASSAGDELVTGECPPPRTVRWASPDGTRISGLLYRQPSRDCRGLVAIIHGGPVWLWRDSWAGRMPLLPLLLGRGFAVLLPNPRGSQGRGAAFTGAIVGEIGGRDAEDVLAGIDTAIAMTGLDRGQAAVIGSSYGGFLAAYLATMPGQVAAAVAISPATEWVSQHYTTNIPASDRRFLTGEPLDPASHYATRNALRLVSSRAAPVLLTAGALDLATPSAQALMFHRALAEHGVDTSLAIYPQEGHDVHHPDAQADLYTRILIWLERYLPRGRS